MFSMSLGINVTLLISAVCYLLLISTSFALLGLGRQKSGLLQPKNAAAIAA